ncbi:LysM peptidoglycan-binding domain-containing protein, partial [Staphylococcus aureus]|nr:LysM peptidoglycan-binding domain-containing protein [Staphylococcus aureus]
MRARASLVIGCLAVGITAGCSVREDEPTPTPEKVFVIVTPTPGTVPAVTRTVEHPTSYVVKAGDNLSDIAAELGISLRALQ